MPRDDELGSLDVGTRADIIVVDPSGPNWIPRHHFSLLPNLVYSGEGRDHETTIIDGAVVMENRVVKTAGVPSILARAQGAAERIVEQLPYRPVLQSPWKCE